MRRESRQVQAQLQYLRIQKNCTQGCIRTRFDLRRRRICRMQTRLRESATKISIRWRGYRLAVEILADTS